MRKFLWILFAGMLLSCLSVAWIGGVAVTSMPTEQAMALTVTLSYVDLAMNIAGFALAVVALFGLRKQGDGGFIVAAILGILCCIPLNYVMALSGGLALFGGQMSLIVSLTTPTLLLVFRWQVFSAMGHLAVSRQADRVRGRMSLGRWFAVGSYVASIGTIMAAARMTALVGAIDPNNIDMDALTQRMMANTGETTMLSLVTLGLTALAMIAIALMAWTLFSAARGLGKLAKQAKTTA